MNKAVIRLWLIALVYLPALALLLLRQPDATAPVAAPALVGLLWLGLTAGMLALIRSAQGPEGNFQQWDVSFYRSTSGAASSAFGFFATYLAVVVNPGQLDLRGWVAFALFFTILVLIQVRLGELAQNPMLRLLGLYVYEGQVADPVAAAAGKRSASVLLLPYPMESLRGEETLTLTRARNLPGDAWIGRRS
jgi:hypothetical protein